MNAKKLLLFNIFDLLNCGINLNVETFVFCVSTRVLKLRKIIFITDICKFITEICNANIFIPNILVVSTLGLSSLPVLAAPTLTGIIQVTAGESTPVTISLSPGHGVNISFIPTGEVIEKVWLDDPSWVVLDVDGCLQNLTQGECTSPSSSVLHLRQIERLNIQGIPKAQTSQLTVVTRSPKTLARRVNVFRLTKSDASPRYHTVEVVQKSNFTGNQTALDSAAIERGRLVAIQQRWLEESSPLDKRILLFIQRLRIGTLSVQEVISDAGISRELVSRLEKLGQQCSTVTCQLNPAQEQRVLSPRVLQVQ